MNLHPWLSNNCFRQAFLAFDMRAPGDMPQRPIVQVMNIVTSTVTMIDRKQTTVRLRCTDGGMDQNTGIIILQPDMLSPSRIQDPDFEIKVGYAVVLLEFRVQQSPKTRLKYLRVSKMLVIDSMVYLRSEIPIQSHQPVAQSRLADRENISKETIGAGAGSLHQEQGPSALGYKPQIFQESTQSSQPVGIPEVPGLSPAINRANVATLKLPSGPPSQHSSCSFQARVTSSFGYRSDTPERLIQLSALSSKNHGDTIDCIAVIQEISPIAYVFRLGKRKRDLHITDTHHSGVILSVWRDLDRFHPTVGDVILLKRVSVHRYQGRSLNAYERAEIVLNPVRDDCVPLREWWELKNLEKSGCFDDFMDDLE